LLSLQLAPFEVSTAATPGHPNDGYKAALAEVKSAAGAAEYAIDSSAKYSIHSWLLAI